MTVPGTSRRRIAAEPASMRVFACDLLTAAGASEGNAAIVSDHLIEASLCGVHSHGVDRLPGYLGEVDAGRVDPAASAIVVSDTGSTLQLDGNRSFGQVAAIQACREAARRARRHQVAHVSLRGAGHLGRIGAYTDSVACDGLIALAWCSVPAPFHSVAWYGTREGRLGTNPMSFAFPTGGQPVVADFSTSAIPEGRARAAARSGELLNEPLFVDSAGVATNDPAVLYSDPPGVIQPLGGALLGHKGSALGLMSEVLGALLSGEDSCEVGRGFTMCLIAIAPSAGFAERADRLIEYIHSAVPLDPNRPALLPGELERTARAKASAVLLEAATLEDLVRAANTCHVAVPDDLRGQLGGDGG